MKLKRGFSSSLIVSWILMALLIVVASGTVISGCNNSDDLPNVCQYNPDCNLDAASSTDSKPNTQKDSTPDIAEDVGGDVVSEDGTAQDTSPDVMVDSISS